MDRANQESARAVALGALSSDQRKRLAAYAELKAVGTGEEGNDLFNEAMVRWLKSDKPIQDADSTCKFLQEAISSIAFNIRRHAKVVRKYEGDRAIQSDPDDEDPLYRAPDSAASPSGPLFVQQIYDLCDDDDVKLLLTAQVDQATPDEIKKELGWDQTKYETVQKRKRRLVIKLTREGQLG